MNKLYPAVLTLILTLIAPHAARGQDDMTRKVFNPAKGQWVAKRVVFSKEISGPDGQITRHVVIVSYYRGNYQNGAAIIAEKTLDEVFKNISKSELYAADLDEEFGIPEFAPPHSYSCGCDFCRKELERRAGFGPPSPYPVVRRNATRKNYAAGLTKTWK